MYKIYKQIIFLLLSLLISSSYAAQATLNRCFRITSSQRTISLFAQKRTAFFPWGSVLYPIKQQNAYVSYISSGKMKTNHLLFASGGCHLHPYSTLQKSQNIQNPQYDKKSLKNNLYAFYSDFFVPCPELLTQIGESFTAENASGKNRYVILHGWIGSGKTTLAQHYGYTHLGKPYEMVWWIDATSAQTIEESLKDICGQLGGPKTRKRKSMNDIHKDIQTRMHRILNNPDKRWLVIWDNLNIKTLRTLKNINKKSFSGIGGDILITTRDFTLFQGISLFVEGLPDQEATELCCQYENPRSEEEKIILAELIDSTKGLPLALKEAGTYIRNTGNRLSHYINLRQKIISEKKDYWGKVANYSQNSLLRKEVEESLARATQIAAEATRLMHLLAYYDYTALSKEVLLQAIISNEFSCSETIFALQQHGLLYYNPATHCLETHPTYQQLLRSQDQAYGYKHLKEAAAILRTLWESEPKQHMMLSPHVDACAAYLMEARHTPDNTDLANVTLPQNRIIKQLPYSPLMGHIYSVFSVAFTTDNKYIVSGGDCAIRIWDLSTGKEVSYSPLKGHTNWVNSVAITTDNKHIISGSDDKAIRIWELKTGKQVPYSPLIGHTASINSVAVTSDNKYIVSGSDDTTIRIWDLSTGEEVSYSPLKGHNDSVRSVAVTTDNKYIISGSDDRTIHIWDLETGKEVSYSPLRGHTHYVLSVVVTTDNKYIVSGSVDDTIRIWDLNTGKQVNHSPLKGHTSWVNSVTITTDNKYIVSGSYDKTIRTWDLGIGKEVLYRPLKGHTKSVNSVAVTADNKYVVSGSADKTLRIWDLNTGEETNNEPKR